MFVLFGDGMHTARLLAGSGVGERIVAGKGALSHTRLTGMPREQKLGTLRLQALLEVVCSELQRVLWAVLEKLALQGVQLVLEVAGQLRRHGEGGGARGGRVVLCTRRSGRCET